MAKFLFTVWPFPGHVNLQMAIAHAVHERGHEVAFYTGAMARPIVTEESFTYFPFKHVANRLRAVVGWPETSEDGLDGSLLYERLTECYSYSPGHGLLTRVKQLKALFHGQILGTVPEQVEDLKAVLAEWQPDVVVCDYSLWGPILVLHETHGIPVAVVSLATCMIPGPDAPPNGFGLPSPRKWHTRLIARLVGAVTDRLAVDLRRAVSAVRQPYGLPPLSTSVAEFTARMPLYLVPSTPEFDYERRDLPPSVHYVGPCLWDKPGNEPPPAWLAELPRDRPWVHVTEGTSHAQAPIVLRAAAQGLANLPMQVVMTTGGSRDPAELGLGPIAGNVRVERWVAHSDLLPRTAVIVTTGGAGTVLAALKAGVPLVVVPTEWDKPENAQRVVEAGAGLRLAPKRCTPERLRAAVERLLSEPSFRRNAQRLAAAFARYGGPARAAELLEGLARPRSAISPAG